MSSEDSRTGWEYPGKRREKRRQGERDIVRADGVGAMAGPHKSDMSEIPKICVIYKNESPSVLSLPLQDEGPWRFEFCPVSAIVGSPIAPRFDFMAVLFPYDGSPELRDYLPRVFPTAEIVGYRENSAESGADPIGTNCDIPVVELPMSAAFAHFLLDSLATIRSGRKEQAAIRGQADDLRAFFDAFVGMVESSASITDRKPAMNLMLQKICV